MMRTRISSAASLALAPLLGAAACTFLSSLDDLAGVPADGGAVDAPADTLGDDSSDAAPCNRDLSSDPQHCGACGNACAPYELCVAASCIACDSANHDCDGDGWLVAEGDCCDKPGDCGDQPELINPGALEIPGNQVDDNCNLFDQEDVAPCDTGLSSSSNVAADYARALGICRMAQAAPEKLAKTWGLLEAQLLRADGSPLGDASARSIRTSFGAVSPSVVEGDALVVLSTGIAADGTQTNPGPNQGAPANSFMSYFHQPISQVDLSLGCPGSACIQDWFASANPPLKAAEALPTAPECEPPFNPSQAFDSVMLRLVIRAPTNMKSFRFRSYFLSAEYPVFVCSAFNDQLVALIDTPTGTPEIANPADKNLATYVDSELQKWPVGINVAKGTGLFSVCESKTDNPDCWNADVATASCSSGAAELAGTGFEKPTGGSCTLGGATGWLTMAGNVVPGEPLELRVVIWDVNDASYDSMVLLDGFSWHPDAVNPGTRSVAE